MAPPANAQRMEFLEQEVAGISNKIAQEVAAAVAIVKADLVSQLDAGFERNFAQMRTELSAMSGLIEGKLMSLREEQGKIREEFRTSSLEDQPLSVGIHRKPPTHGGGNGGGRPWRRENEEGEADDGGFHGGVSNWKLRKLDLPIFDGVNPDGWILRAERFFHFYRLSEEEQLKAAIVALNGDALLWYQWAHDRHPITTWAALKGMLLHRFRNQQRGSVEEYCREFIELMAPIKGIPEELAKG